MLYPHTVVSQTGWDNSVTMNDSRSFLDTGGECVDDPDTPALEVTHMYLMNTTPKKVVSQHAQKSPTTVRAIVHPQPQSVATVITKTSQGDVEMSQSILQRRRRFYDKN